MTKHLSELIANLPDVIRVSGDVLITAPVTESDADLQPGGLFVARPGYPLMDTISSPAQSRRARRLSWVNVICAICPFPMYR